MYKYVIMAEFKLVNDHLTPIYFMFSSDSGWIATQIVWHNEEQITGKQMSKNYDG